MENVTVNDHGYQGYENLCLSWVHNGARFHVWENDGDKGFVYKNSIAEINKPGYFSTRRLDPETKQNRKLIIQARTIAKAEGLYEKAIANREEEFHQRLREAIKHAEKELKERAAEDLYTALKLALESMELALVIEYGPAACTQMEWEAEPLATIRAAIAKAEGNGERN